VVGCNPHLRRRHRHQVVLVVRVVLVDRRDRRCLTIPCALEAQGVQEGQHLGSATPSGHLSALLSLALSALKSLGLWYCEAG